MQLLSIMPSPGETLVSGCVAQTFTDVDLKTVPAVTLWKSVSSPAPARHDEHPSCPVCCSRRFHTNHASALQTGYSASLPVVGEGLTMVCTVAHTLSMSCAGGAAQVLRRCRRRRA